MTQVDAVRRKLVASLHKRAIDDGVNKGLDRTHLEDVLVLCGGDSATVERQWGRWCATRTPEQFAADAKDLDMREFIAFLQEQQPKSRTPVPGHLRRKTTKRKRRKGGRS